jgi:HlyD family secretion protein
VKNAGTEAEVTTFPVRIALTVNVPGALPGMSGQATISTETRQNALTVPLQAVTVRSEKQLAAAASKDGKEKPPEGAPPPGPGGTAAARKASKEPQQKVVFVVEDGKARVRRVETGLASENEIELTSGVKAGEIIVEGPYKLLSRELADGKAVKFDKPDAKKDAAGTPVSGEAKAGAKGS